MELELTLVRRSTQGIETSSTHLTVYSSQLVCVKYGSLRNSCILPYVLISKNMLYKGVPGVKLSTTLGVNKWALSELILGLRRGPRIRSSDA